ncbi:hypothetical protein O0I10_006242 [Lichtheimia ornata]|uniref:Uncharacterized protein n=1 Tax=Lichtheimia ornata TaxID=688661 RepID=A0AAD7V5G6_9FUNG|nr:uncharacterized protein O0I10_006242 [Lichtheimia ornata]KAJ8657971.1 hypothetical protein O0I10_006242 [Lichtheimia ornata]
MPFQTLLEINSSNWFNVSQTFFLEIIFGRGAYQACVKFNQWEDTPTNIGNDDYVEGTPGLVKNNTNAWYKLQLNLPNEVSTRHRFCIGRFSSSSS